ncbi:MAG: DUF3775 domain-containing protein [Beduini sp.]|uniref:DUF3775 domain-containing protein n=1 Tax=Beduini sp. TaxID=1922300 RepID=UPI0011C7672E
MYKNLVSIAKKIIKLANESKEDMFKGKDCIEVELDFTDDVFLSDPFVNQMEDILNKLSFEEVMSLQTIMYLGRDGGYDKNLTPDEIYDIWFKSISSTKNDKEIEINQMVEKFTLGEYLKRGYEILGIYL